MAKQGRDSSKASTQKRQANNKKKLIIFGAEIAIILIMLVVLYFVWKFGGSDRKNDGGTSGTGPHITSLDTDALGIDPSVKEQDTMKGYMNIALFGVDARNEKELFKNSRSDTIMIASVNLDTGDIKLVSVYRDSYLNLSNDTYNKCNGAYSKGGAQQAVGMLNMNLDMDITNFITVGYAGLAEVIDGLGGVWIDVDQDELQHINNYQYSIIGKNAKKYGIEVSSELNFTPDEYFADYDLVVVKEPGYQLLNGLQAAAYCRIRYVGNDFQRTARQREVIKAIEAQAKQADLATLTKAFEGAMNDIYTNLDMATIMEMLPKIANYRIVDESGFPEMDMRQSVSMGAKGACEVPVDLASSVSWLHGFLFGDEGYSVSDTVKEITAQIKSDASKYLTTETE